MSMNNRVQVIQSLQNSKVKEWASLLEKKHRDRAGLFLMEGVHVIQEAVKSGADVRAVVYDEERGLPAELRTLGYEGELYEVPQHIIAKCTGTDTPPPVFGVVGKLRPEHDALYAADALVVVLDNVRDPGNVGTIIRSADAVGATAVVLGKGCADLYNPKTVRSTMGSLFHLPIVEGELPALLPAAKKRGIKLVGTSLQAEHSCFAADWTESTWLLLGNESTGLSQEAAPHVDESVLIPMRGQAESLNVAMAATVLLHEAMRQRYFNSIIIPVQPPK